MSNYTKTTNFATKDSLASGNPNKIVKGTEINSEFDNIATAVATKANTASPSLTGTVTAAALNVTGNLDVDGTLEFDSISGTGSVAVTDIADEDNMSSNSATKLATQQSIKAYVDSQVTAQDLDLTDGSTSISIDLDSEALSVLGGTGVTSTASGNGVTLAIDSTVTTLTGSQTLTNKTLTSPDVNTPDIDGGTIDGTVIGGATAAAGSFTTVGATGNITVGGTVDGRDVATDGTKLDGIEASADVTDTANVTAAGALMDSELTAIASVKALNQGVATGDSPTFVDVTATSLDISGNIDVDGVTNLDATNIVGALDVTGTATMDGLTVAETIRSDNNANASSHNILVSTTNKSNTLMAYGVDRNGTVTGIQLDGKIIAPELNVTGTATMDSLVVEQNVGSKITLSSTDTAIAANEVIGEIDFYSSDASGIGAASRVNISAVAADAAGAGDVYIKTSTGGAVVANRLKVANNGDISFYEDTGSSPKFFWDASAESLGIGAIPNQILTLDKASGDVFTRFDKGGAIKGLIGIADSTASGSTGSVQGDMIVRGQTNLLLDTAGTTRVKVDASGNVGIGTSSPASLVSGGSSPVLSIGGTDTVLTTGDKSGSVSFITNDASYQNTYSDGITGEIASVAESSTGAAYGLAFYTGTTASVGRGERVRIDASGHAIIPAGITLGTSAGVYNAANTLDDYEEGTWTPTIIGSTSGTASINVATSSYTKIGNTVRVDCFISAADVTGLNGVIRLSGLPFGAVGYCPVTITYCNLFSFDESTTSVGGYVESGNTYVNLVKGSSKTTISSTEANATSGTLMFQATYKTNA